MVCSRSASRVPVIGIARELPVAHERWVGLFSACVPPVPGVRSDSKEVCARHEVVGMSVAHANSGRGSTENGGTRA